MSGLTLQLATEDQLPEIAAIERASFPDPWSREFLTRVIRSGDIVFETAVRQGRTVGYCAMRHVLDEGEIFNVAVSAEDRGRGAGERLLRSALRRGRTLDLDRIHLEVRAGNGAAIALYKKLGFTPVALNRGYYQRPREDAVIMTYRYEEERP